MHEELNADDGNPLYFYFFIIHEYFLFQSPIWSSGVPQTGRDRLWFWLPFVREKILQYFLVFQLNTSCKFLFSSFCFEMMEGKWLRLPRLFPLLRAVLVFFSFTEFCIRTATILGKHANWREPVASSRRRRLEGLCPVESLFEQIDKWLQTATRLREVVDWTATGWRRAFFPLETCCGEPKLVYVSFYD